MCGLIPMQRAAYSAPATRQPRAATKGLTMTTKPTQPAPSTAVGTCLLTAEEISHLAQLGSDVAEIKDTAVYGHCDECGKPFSKGSVLFLGGEKQMKCADCIKRASDD